MKSAVQLTEKLAALRLGMIDVSNFIQISKEFVPFDHGELYKKVMDVIESLGDDRLKIVVIGGFSEGKTSIIAGLIGKVDVKTMRISQAESTDDVNIYRFYDDVDIVDTPGLFGYKEKSSSDSEPSVKYKEVTEKYLSSAHIVLYVMNSENPLKESHKEELNWLFVKLNLLPRTVFILSRFDGVCDIEDQSDYERSLSIKRNSFNSRILSLIDLPAEVVYELPLVGVSANPYDLGIDEWISRSDYKKISRIEVVEKAIVDIISNTGGKSELIQKQIETTVLEVVNTVGPLLEDQLQSVSGQDEQLVKISGQLDSDIGKLVMDLDSAKQFAKTEVTRYLDGLVNRIRGQAIESFKDFYDKNIGSDGEVIASKVASIISSAFTAISSEIDRINFALDTELEVYDGSLVKLGISGIKMISGSKMIDNESVLAVRNAIQTGASAFGLDLSDLLKFKPWGATELASKLGGFLSLLGAGLALYDLAMENEKREKFDQVKRDLIEEIEREKSKIVGYIVSDDFYKNTFPEYRALCVEQESIRDKISEMEERVKSLQGLRSQLASLKMKFRIAR